MRIGLWILLFLLLSAVCAWIVFGNGAATLAGLFAAFLFGASLEWSEDGVRLFVGLLWLLTAIWFVVGLLVPEVRLPVIWRRI